MNIQILYYIQRNLDFGRIIKQGKTTSRFVVEDIANVALIIALFNGHFVFFGKLISFQKYLEAFNNRVKTVTIIPIITLTLVTPSYWLCGMTDAEGCFTFLVIPFFLLVANSTYTVLCNRCISTTSSQSSSSV
jgi:hypothetical protein